MFKPNQEAAIKKLEAALLSVKRAGLVLVGIDDSLHITVDDEDLTEAARRDSNVEAVLARNNSGHPGTQHVKHYGCFLDSGGT